MMSFPTNESEGVLIDTPAVTQLVVITSTISIGYDDSLIDDFFQSGEE